MDNLQEILQKFAKLSVLWGYEWKAWSLFLLTQVPVPPLEVLPWSALVGFWGSFHQGVAPALLCVCHSP